MVNDLERFLQQAAERLAEKVKQSQPAAQTPPRRRPMPSVREAERATPELLEPEIVDAVVLEPTPEPDRNPLSELDTRHLEVSSRPSLAQEIGLADERMASHVQHVTSGDVMHLRDASEALQGGNAISGSTQVTHRQRQVSSLVTMLRNPSTLRAAFIASQIFERKCR